MRCFAASEPYAGNTPVRPFPVRLTGMGNHDNQLEQRRSWLCRRILGASKGTHRVSRHVSFSGDISGSTATTKELYQVLYQIQTELDGLLNRIVSDALLGQSKLHHQDLKVQGSENAITNRVIKRSSATAWFWRTLATATLPDKLVCTLLDGGSSTRLTRLYLASGLHPREP